MYKYTIMYDSQRSKNSVKLHKEVLCKRYIMNDDGYPATVVDNSDSPSIVEQSQ